MSWGEGLTGNDYNSLWTSSLIVIERYSEVLECARRIKVCDQRRVFLHFRDSEMMMILRYKLL